MEKKTTELEKHDSQGGAVERTSNRPQYVPFTDILERENGLQVIMDVPGVDEKDIDIHLEDGVLTITAKVEDEVHDGFRPLYTEYGVGDYQRSFRLVEDFNDEGIEAQLKQGVLTISLPKSEKAKPRKIEIKA